MRRATLPTLEKSENTPLLQCLKPAECAAVHARMSYRVFRAGEQILQQDKLGSEVFFIDHGCVKICHSNLGRAFSAARSVPRVQCRAFSAGRSVPRVQCRAFSAAPQMQREVILSVVGQSTI